MWHVTFEPNDGNEAKRQFTKCIEGCVEPPTGVCLVCELERRIKELEVEIEEMRAEMLLHGV